MKGRFSEERRQVVGDGVREIGGGCFIESLILGWISPEENPEMRVWVQTAVWKVISGGMGREVGKREGKGRIPVRVMLLT